MYLGTRRAEKPWTVDLKRFRVYLRERYNVTEAYYFIGAYEPQLQDLYDNLQKFGYIIVFREHASTVLSHKKGNVDTDIVFFMMKKLVEQEDFNKIILVSGDGDYWRVVNYLIQNNKFEKLLIPNKNKLSSLYKMRTPDTYRIYLDDTNIKKLIKYTKK